MSRTRHRMLLSCTAVWIGCADHATNPVGDAGIPPQGSIAFASTRGARWQWPDIYMATSDGSELTRVTLGTSPAWSWDGQRIAFYRSENPYDRAGVYVADADGSNERFVSPGYNPAWSPDGRLAFGSGGGIAVSNAGASRFQSRLVDRAWAEANGDEGGCGPDSWGGPWADHPAWSPDGQRIAFVVTCGDSGVWTRIFVMHSDGSEPLALLESRRAGPPAWSPDGTSIAAWIDGAITTIDPNSGNLQVHYRRDDITGPKLDWSPDGRRIVFVAWSPDKEQRIFVLTLETGVVRQLIADVWLSPGVMDYYQDFNVAWVRVIQ